MKFSMKNTWPRGFKTFSMLNSGEHEIYPAHKCLNAYNGWAFNVYGQTSFAFDYLNIY